jgi:TonB-linked SusC/RagA family outer membrane protein
LNINHKLSKSAEFGANLTFARINQATNSERSSYANPFMNIAATVLPSDQVYGADGEWSRSFPGNNSLNPKQSAELNKNNSKLTRSLNSVWGSYEFIEGLKLRQTLSYDYNIANDFVYWDARTKDGESFDGLGQKDIYEKGKFNSATNLQFVKTIAEKHHLDVLAGYEVEDVKTDFLYAARSNYPNYILTDLDNASEDQGSGASVTESKLISYLTRVNYDYDDKYYLGGSYRTDGSSRLAKDNRWGKFWSVSGAWVVNKEDFLNDITFLNNLKVRSSYGVNGTQPSDLYGYLGTYGYGNNYNSSPGSAEDNVPNPDLKWETNYALNVGLDVRVFNRLSVSVDWFNRDTKDLLQDIPSSLTTGFSSYLANIGEMNNKGWELEISSENIKDLPIKWTTTVTASWIRNKVIKLDGVQDQIVSTASVYNNSQSLITKVGFPYYSFYLKEFVGVNSQTGAAQYYTNTLDANGKYVKEITEDVSKANPIAIEGKSADPKLFGGITNTVSYKGVDLSFLLTYSLGGYTYDGGAAFNQADGYRSLSNISTEQLNRWQKPGDVTDVPRFVFGNANGGQNATTRRLHSSDHLRLKNLSLGYNIPSKLTKSIGVENFRIYFAGSNLLTWAAYDQYDPETRPNGVVAFNTPPLKTYTFGLEVKF